MATCAMQRSVVVNAQRPTAAAVPPTWAARPCPSCGVEGSLSPARRPLSSRRHRLSVTCAAAGEAPEQALQRRLRESQRVDERVKYIYNIDDWHRELAGAGSGLVVLEAESSTVCDTGLAEEAELHWRDDRQAAMARCTEVKHVFARTARDCPEVKFLAVEAEGDEAQALCEELGITVLPTVQFWKDGAKLWEHRGIVQLQQDLGEGVLYYGDSAANGVKASTFVKDITTKAEYDDFIKAQPDNVLTVVQMSLQSATPCVRIFPATMALAKNFQGYAAFGRLIGDASNESRQLLRDLDIKEVPTFVFYRAAKEVGRHVGSSRGDLIGKILQQQNALGIAPPPVQRPAKKVVQQPTQRRSQPSPASLWR